MISRRLFLRLLGLSTLASPAFGQEPGQRRTRWEMLANDREPDFPEFRPDPSQWDDNRITVSWIGHATVLINFFGISILTDPVFSDRIGLNVLNMFTIGPRRLVHPALTFEDIPPIDLLLVSHAHMDHLDTPTLGRFRKSIPLIMAKNTADVVEDMGFEELYELDWGEWTEVKGVRIEALKVRHFGWRYPWERDRSRGFHEGRSYNAYLITRNGHSILFGGDTAYHELFRDLARRNISPVLAIMPIGAYDPWIHNHVNPEQALTMVDHMGAYHILPIHWNTFIQSEEPTTEPIRRLHAACKDTPDRVVIDSIGQTWSVDPA